MIVQRIIVIVLLLASLLVGCVSSQMKQFIGKDISEVMVEHGRPHNVFDMPDGRKAYQFYWGGGSFALPQTTTGSANVNR